MDLTKIRAAKSVTDLREAAAELFEELSKEESILERLAKLEAKHE